MAVIKLVLPWITSWIWQVRLNYSTSCINCVTSLLPFQPFLFSGVFIVSPTPEGRVACRGAQQAGGTGHWECHEAVQRQMQSPAPGMNDPTHQYRVAIDELDSIFAEKVLVEKLTMS